MTPRRPAEVLVKTVKNNPAICPVGQLSYDYFPVEVIYRIYQNTQTFICPLRAISETISSLQKRMIHISEVHKIVEHGEFSLRFISTAGEIIEGKRCVCTSFHSEGRTMNIKFCDSGQIRKVRRCSIVSINDKEVAI